MFRSSGVSIGVVPPELYPNYGGLAHDLDCLDARNALVRLLTIQGQLY